MIIIIEIDRQFTLGIDPNGIRLGFVAIHWAPCRLDAFVKIYKEVTANGNNKA